MEQLHQEKCQPCKTGTTPLVPATYASLLESLSTDWTVIDEQKLKRTFRFSDFASALAFTNEVGKLAEAEGHHPDIYLAWSKVEITIWTHKIHGLSRSDFVLAAKIDVLSTERTK